MASVFEEIGPYLSAKVLVISIAAGISTKWIRERSGEARKIVRAMPNAAALVGQSATGLYFRPRLGAEARKVALRIFDSVGETVVVDKEEHLNIVTGLSGSGPAYVFLFLEALTDAGVERARENNRQTTRRLPVLDRRLSKQHCNNRQKHPSPKNRTLRF